MASTIESGTDLSHYRVIGPIGAGGMGEVYKAHDTRLERTIALKILPPGLVKNEERLRRFMQEARSASSLNHPHIVTIHEIGETTIASDDGDAGLRPIHYIAMELIDGSTLRSRIHDERTDLRTLLGYLAQAAEGLAKAHTAGIVHRDLKPENIMVTRDGFAKVLDFGLAKLTLNKGVTEATLTNGILEATAVRDETREGTILGTVAYMSPEQVQGKLVDHRSDIFSFGSIVYEAATRRRPFDADSDVDVMHRIMHEKPVPVDEIDPSVPAELRRVIRRCLAKDPEKRYQSMKDLAIELREIVDEFEELSASAASRSSGSVSQPAAGGVPLRRGVVWGAAALIAAIAIGSIAFGVYHWRKAETSSAMPAPFTSLRMQRLTTTGNVAGIAISPDGKYLAYAVNDGGDFSLLVRQISTGADVQVAEPGSSFSGATFSPDGEYIYYSRRDGDTVPVYSWLYQVPVLGGTPRKIIFDVDTRVTFSPDGRRFVFGRGVVGTSENHYVMANTDGSGERILAVLPRYGSSPVAPAWSPDGRRIITSVGIPPSGFDSKLVEIDVESGTVRDFGAQEWWTLTNIAWKPDGSGVIVTAVHPDSGRSQLWFQPYPDGTPHRITNDLNNYGIISLTADGRTAVVLQRDTDLKLSMEDPGDPTGGTPLPTDARRSAAGVSASAAGPIVFSLADELSSDIALLEAPDRKPRLITNNGTSFGPSISADGKRVAYVSYRKDGPPNIYVADADGGGERQLTRGDGEFNPQISPDGRTIIYTAGFTLWRVSADGGTAARIEDDTAFPNASAHSAAISRDSTRVAYLHMRMEEGGSRQYLRVKPLAGGPPIVDRLWERPGRLRWMPDDRSLSYVWGRGAGNVYVQPLDGSEARQLTSYTTGIIESYDWTADGKLVVNRGNVRTDAVLMSGLE